MATAFHLFFFALVSFSQGIQSEKVFGRVTHTAAQTQSTCETACEIAGWCRGWTFEDKCILNTDTQEKSHHAAFGVDHVELLQVLNCPPIPGFDYYDDTCMAMVPLTLEDGCTVEYPYDGSCWTICSAGCHKFEDPCFQTCSEVTCNPADECCDPNGFPLAEGTSCGTGLEECSDQDTCDGLGVCQENHVVVGMPCGDPSSAECNDPDTCNGQGVCRSNLLSGNPCGDPTDVPCDLADTCSNGVCMNNIITLGDPCVGGDPTENECNHADTCDGAGVCNFNLEPNTTPCGSQLDTECDNPNTCDAGVCGDNFESSGFSCGDPSDTDCDNPDTCDGGGTCLTNLEAAGFACGDASSTECTAPDTCDGAGVCEDNHMVDYTMCDDHEVCNCFTGQCQCDCNYRSVINGYGDISMKSVGGNFRVQIQTIDDDRWHGIGFRVPGNTNSMVDADAYLIYNEEFDLMDTFLTAVNYGAIPTPDPSTDVARTFLGIGRGHITHGFERPLNTGDPNDVVIADVAEGTIGVNWSKGENSGDFALAYHGFINRGVEPPLTYCQLQCDPSYFIPGFGEIRVKIIDSEAALWFSAVVINDGFWFGVGIGQAPVFQMPGAKTYIALGPNGDMEDYYNDPVDKIVPTRDPIQDITQCRNIVSGNKKIVEWKVPLNSGDPNDAVVDPSATFLQLVWAIGSTENLSQHVDRGQETVTDLCHDP